MQEKHIKAILTSTGAITMLPVLQYFLPGSMLALQGLSVSDDTGYFFAQHWGFLAFCFGAMLVYAARRPVHRTPIVLAAGVEKLAFVALIAFNWNYPALQGFHLPAFFDATCVILYALILMSPSKSIPK